MFKIQSFGGPELIKALNQLGLKASTSVLVSALTEGAEPIRAAMASGAPRSDEAPHIADNIGISRARTEDQAAVAIGPVKGFAYGVPLEVGTVDTAAQPFARPAYDGNIDRSMQITAAAIWRELAGKGISRPSAVDLGPVETPGGGGLL